MNVLSLFDGMSCGQQALERAGFKVTNYFASEIDKHAIKVTMANYPNTIQLGSVVDVDGYSLPKIDLLIGGSPCQSFSFAGKRKGMSTKCDTEILTLEHYLQLKSEGFEFEGQSYLFWEYMRLLNETKPKYFLLENVEMGEKWERVLSKAIGVNGVHINSALVSAQNRKRIYWTNIGHEPGGLFGDLVCKIKQPKDKGILLKDILEKEVDEKYYLSEKMINHFNTKHTYSKFKFEFHPTDVNKKGASLTASMGKMPITQDYIIKIDKQGNIKAHQNKASCFTAVGNSGGNHSDMDLIVHNTMPRSSTSGKGGTGPLSRTDGKTYCLDTWQTNAVEIKCLNKNQLKKFNPNINADKANTLTLAQGRAGSSEEYMDAVSKIAAITSRIRRLTPTECERLQTVADGYTNHVSDSQRYKMLGNGWTVNVIVHILNYIKL